MSASLFAEVTVCFGDYWLQRLRDGKAARSGVMVTHFTMEQEHRRPGNNMPDLWFQGGAPSGFRTPDRLIKSWQVMSIPVGSDPRPVHVVPQAIRSPNWSGWGWSLPVDRVSRAA